MHLYSTYEALIQKNHIKLDPAQRYVVEKLHLLNLRLSDSYSSKASFLSMFKQKSQLPGIYIYGNVGRGKSMLMSLFFEHVENPKKKRQHFHEFMILVHNQMKALRSKHQDKGRLLKVIARNIYKDIKVLCLDELEIKDIVDAMIVAELFQELFKLGLILVTTSNRAPEELYEDGLQRDKFLGFISLVTEKLQVLELKSEQDWRMTKIAALQQTYFYPLNERTDKQLRQIVSGFTEYGQLEKIELEVKGRKLEFRDCIKDLAILEFDEICNKPLGSEDYLAICQNFSIILLKNIPQLSRENRNESRRLSLFIDQAYENRILLIISSEVEPNRLYIDGDMSFEFQRTISRLIEIQSEEYINKSKGSNNGNVSS